MSNEYSNITLEMIDSKYKNCGKPYEHPEAGHFVQEWGEEIARKALAEFER